MKDKSVKKSNLYKAVGISLIVIDIILFITLIGFMIDGPMEKKFDPTSLDIDPNSQSAEVNFDDPVLGNPEAPVTITEYSDFECPFCSRFYNGAYKDIVENYVDTGKVKIVFKDFPLTQIHKNAMISAQAMECANEQGKAFEMHDKIFEEGSPTQTSLKLWAVELGLDSEDFDACLDSNKYEQEILEDIKEGASKGVSGTPTLFVNNKKIVGAQPFSVFRQAIEEELAAAQTE